MITSTPRILILCYYDPAGIATVIETIENMAQGLTGEVRVINLFLDYYPCTQPALRPSVDLDGFDAIIIHNTLSYNVDVLRGIDRVTHRTLRDFHGVKILMKQDENHRFRELAQAIGDIGFDVIFTCLPPTAVPRIYPPEIVGTPRFERMLTGYVTATLRQLPITPAPRPILIGYRGSLQPLSFGRLAYEKRKIGNDVVRLLQDSGLKLDVSSRWEDRLGNAAWYTFLSACTATLGVESGASIFDLQGNLAMRCTALEGKLGPVREDDAYAEAYLAGLADLENNIPYHQISPRHFEAAATGTIQLLYPGDYSGIFIAGRHYFELARDYSNLADAIAFLQDDAARDTMAQTARREIIDNPAYHIETFVARLNSIVQECLDTKPVARRHVIPIHTILRMQVAALRHIHPKRLVKWLLPSWVQTRLRCLPHFRQGLCR